MASLYKLTSAAWTTMGGALWGPGVTQRGDGRGCGLYSPSVIHAYRDRVLGEFMCDFHGYSDASCVAWEYEGDVAVENALLVGCTSLTTLRRVDRAQVTADQRIRFGLLCALQVCDCPFFQARAQLWLTGDRENFWKAHNEICDLLDWSYYEVDPMRYRGALVARFATVGLSGKAAAHAFAMGASIDFGRIAREVMDHV